MQHPVLKAERIVDSAPRGDSQSANTPTVYDIEIVGARSLYVADSLSGCL